MWIIARNKVFITQKIFSLFFFNSLKFSFIFLPPPSLIFGVRQSPINIEKIAPNYDYLTMRLIIRQRLGLVLDLGFELGLCLVLGLGFDLFGPLLNFTHNTDKYIHSTQLNQLHSINLVDVSVFSLHSYP